MIDRNNTRLKFTSPRPPTGTSWEVVWQLHNYRSNSSSRFVS